MKTTLLLGVMIVVTMSSCRTSALLTATFESESIGSLPTKDIPGAPAGDSIKYSVPLQPRIKVVASSTSSREKALEFNQSPASGLTAHNQWLQFAGIRTDLTQPIYFYYTAVHSGGNGRLTIDLSDGSATIMVRMYILGSGEVDLVTDLPTDQTTEIGTIPVDVPHIVIFTVNVRAGTYSLAISSRGENITVNNRPLITTDPLLYDNPARPSIHFRYDDGVSPANRYVLEDMHISKRRP